jgi:peptidoglycan/LPS O-acetylase OafA/YrhL
MAPVDPLRSLVNLSGLQPASSRPIQTMQTVLSRHVPELDGLRGIAIISVIVHHQLTPFSLPGGFLGVDLFFVLSGFLITTLLSEEFSRTKTISLRKFYMRRVLRLGPALFLYLLACLIVTYYTQLIEITRELKLIGFALIYLTNWRMAFGWDPVLDPTAIIWSLSIEEQFYLVWPLLFSGCLVLKLKRRFIIAGLVVSILSVMAHRYSLLNAGSGLLRLYYGTDTRADALLTGCLLALLPVATIGVPARRYLNHLALIAAVALLCLIGTTHFEDQFLYRSGYTVVALLAGVVVMVAAHSPPRILAAALRWPPLRWFGKISYGLYLWHWLVVRSTSFYYLGYWEPWARLALAVGIASFSFYLVEHPFNNLKSRFSIRTAEARSHLKFAPQVGIDSNIPTPVPLAN